VSAVVTARPVLEVADVLRAHGPAFLEEHGSQLSAAQRRALQELAQCRTAALGGHTERCAGCGHERIAYNSCRNRHCPKCPGAARAAWLLRETGTLLPVEYHHVVFTLPHALGPLTLANPRVLYDELFRAAWATVHEVAGDPHYLGATVGLLAVLHTWGQTLCHHPHLHCVVTGGGLACDAQGRVQEPACWRSCRPGFFLPVRVLGRLFRGKFLAGLRAAYQAGRLVLPAKLAGLAEPAAFAAWLTPLYQRDWVVYAKPPFAGPEVVLKYLARYSHGVALSNHRLVEQTGATVTFRYRDYADDRHVKQLTLAVDEFLRRFLQHVLPPGFVKVRHYGLLANRYREAKLHVCRRLLLVVVTATRADSSGATAAPKTPCCPVCAGQVWQVVTRLPRPTVAEICCWPFTVDSG
jgi:Putative transposase/Transposase zinc-binding domain